MYCELTDIQEFNAVIKQQSRKLPNYWSIQNIAECVAVFDDY